MTRVSRVMLKQLPEVNMLSVRRTIDFFNQYSDFMGEAIDSILSLIRKNIALPSSGPIVCFHNMDLEALDVEVGFQVAQPIESEGAVTAGVVESRTVAVAIDRGPYEEQDPTLEDLMKWIPENGFEAIGGICYHYLNDEGQPQSEYLTEMYIPVKKV